MKSKVVPLGRDWTHWGRQMFFWHFSEGDEFYSGVGTGNHLVNALKDFVRSIDGEVLWSE